jgi:hypothetical protein
MTVVHSMLLLLLLALLLSIFTNSINVDDDTVKTTSSRLYHLITYATDRYIYASSTLLISAVQSGAFDRVRLYGQEDLDPLYLRRNERILNQPKGAGYWIYKPYILLHYLYNIAGPGDVVCYLDSTYLFTGSFRNVLDRITSNPGHIGLLQGNNRPDLENYSFLEIRYTKKDAFLILDADKEAIKASEQYWGGLVAVESSFTSIQFVSAWYTFVQDERAVSDETSVLQEEDEAFIVHRHDQSIISLLAKKWEISPAFLSESESLLLRKQNYSSIIQMSGGDPIEIVHFNRLLYEQGQVSCRKTYTEEQCVEIETFVNSVILRMPYMKDREACRKTYTEELCHDLQLISDKQLDAYSKTMSA